MTLKRKASFSDVDLWLSTILLGLKDLNHKGTFAFKITTKYIDLFCNFLFLFHKWFKKVEVFKSEDILGFRSVCYIIGFDYKSDNGLYDKIKNLHLKFKQGEIEEIKKFKNNLIFGKDFYPKCLKAIENILKIQNNAMKKILQNQKGGEANDFIRLLTYNVCWERMYGELGPKSKLDGRKCLRKNKNICRHNVIDYIQYISKKEKLDIICLQEETNINRYLKLPLYHHYLTKGDKEFMITYWNKKKYHVISKYHTDFESDDKWNKNRPLQILFIQSKSTKEITILFNLHAGHDTWNNFSNFMKVVNKVKFSHIELELLKTNRIIICGDFNNQYPIRDGKLNNKAIFGKRRFYNQSKKPTCCYNFEERKPIHKLDHILTTSKLSAYHIHYINKHKISKHFCYIYGYFSDHIPVLGIVG